jgi:tRNA-uridine 2-sulfurtransferase
MGLDAIVGLSGGVDSSVAALLLKQKGLDVAGLFMKNWEEDDRDGPCRAEDDARDAEAVAELLGIPFYTRNFSAEYWDGVFAHFLAEYRKGRTPNPDILCNREIKFRTFLDQARDLGAGRIATGHYARIGHAEGRFLLLRGRDSNKDQSYFLYTLGQEQLAATLFPVGELPKAEVRALAREAGLPTHAKKDSTGICFIGPDNFREFLSRYLPGQPGEMRTPEGVVVGQHPGVAYFTLGQRQGLGIGGVRGADETPWFVLAKRVDDNVLIVGQGHDHPWLMSRRLLAGELSWVDGTPPAVAFDCTARTRYRQQDESCKVRVRDDGSVELAFPRAQRAVTPGQALVLYHGEVCLGGGTIEATDAPCGGLDEARAA